MSLEKELLAQSRRLTETLGIAEPILGAPMWGASSPELVAAVSNAGGLGILPVQSMTGEAIVEAAARVKALTDRPFALNIRVEDRHPSTAQATQAVFDALEPLREELKAEPVIPAWPSFEEQFEAILASDVSAVSFSFGGPREVYAEALEARGIMMIGNVNSTREAKVLRTAGCHVIVAQGAEAGGPRQYFENAPEASRIGLMALLPPVVRVAGSIPVVAAGAVMSARSVLSCLMLGACGVELGSYLLRTKESAWTEAMKAQIAWCDDATTRLTTYTNGRETRVLPTGLAAALADAGVPSAGYPGQWLAQEAVYEAARTQDRLDLLEMPMGQAAQVAPAGGAEEALNKIIKEVKEYLGEMNAD
ncbi:MAG TPA: nitronate monooxygenase [Candidatus Aphodousia gallistercoris]|nr:nitronate monooxygenase [Candidatus Aphodousia gallistercoris]